MPLSQDEIEKRKQWRSKDVRPGEYIDDYGNYGEPNDILIRDQIGKQKWVKPRKRSQTKTPLYSHEGFQTHSYVIDRDSGPVTVEATAHKIEDGTLYLWHHGTLVGMFNIERTDWYMLR